MALGCGFLGNGSGWDAGPLGSEGGFMTSLECTPRKSTRTDSIIATPTPATTHSHRVRTTSAISTPPPQTTTRCDFFPSLPTELLLCIITMGGLVQNDYGWLNAFGKL